MSSSSAEEREEREERQERDEMALTSQIYTLLKIEDWEPSYPLSILLHRAKVKGISRHELVVPVQK